MKKIINGKGYDTDTATFIGECDIGDPLNNLEYCTESLYVKRTGEFFIFGWGGPYSKYSKAISENRWAGGEAIIPLEYEEAKEWATQHLTPEKVEKFFGAVDDGYGLHVSIPTDLARKAKQKALSQGCTLGDVVTDALREYLK